MKTATIRLIHHDFGSVLNWVDEGEQVAVTRRGKVVALITAPPMRARSRARKRPDFAARLKLRDGARVIPAAVMADILDFDKGPH